MAAIAYDPGSTRRAGSTAARPGIRRCHTPSPYSDRMTLVAADQPYLRTASRPPAAVFWRRRAVALVLIVASSTAAMQVLDRLGDGPLSVGESVPALASSTDSHYLVQPGDTLWSIARSVQPEGDIRPLVHRLAAQLEGRSLLAGDRLLIP